MRGAVLLAVVFLAAGCEGAGGLLVISNPAIARLLAMSEKEGLALPPRERFAWTQERFAIEASDFERALGRNDGDAAASSAGRLLRFLAYMHALSDADQADRLLEASRGYTALAEAVCTGRVGRGALTAARHLRHDVEDDLQPARGHLPVTVPRDPEAPPKNNKETSGLKFK